MGCWRQARCPQWRQAALPAALQRWQARRCQKGRPSRLQELAEWAGSGAGWPQQQLWRKPALPQGLQGRVQLLRGCLLPVGMLGPAELA